MIQPQNQGDILGQNQANAAPAWLGLNGSDVADHVELLQSRSLAQDVAALLDSNTLSALVAGEENLSDTAAIVQSSVDVRPVKETDIIQIQATGPTPALAMTLANTYVEAYKQYNLEQSRTDVTAVRVFIENQLKVVEAGLDSAERNLATFKEQNRLVDVDAEDRGLIDQQTNLAVADNQAQTQIQGLEAKLNLARTRIAQDSPKVGARLNDISSPLVASLKANLDQLEVDKANLFIQGFPEQSTRIQNLNQQIADVRQQLAAESRKLVTQDNLLDPVSGLTSLYESQLDLEAELEAAQAQAGVVRAAVDSNDASLSLLPQAERQFVRLSRDVETDRDVYSLLSQRYEEARIQEAGRVSDVRIVDVAQNARKVRPKVLKNLVLGFMLGLVLAFGTGLGVEYLDTSIHSPRDVERQGYSVLASIPRLPAAGPRRALFGPNRVASTPPHLICRAEPNSPGAEAFRVLRTSIQFAGLDKPLRTIVVTSPGPSEGKSTVAVNLATVFAQAGHRTLLLDADLRRPILHTVFGHRKKPGFTDMILLGSPSTDAVFLTDIDKLFCLPSGQIPPSPADVLNSTAAKELLQRLSHDFEYVIIDTPPVLVAADTAIVAARADTTLFVVRAGKTTTEGIEHAVQSLTQSGAKVSGFVVNRVKRTGHYGRDYYYYYHYRYSHRHHHNKPWSWLTGRHGQKHEAASEETAADTTTENVDKGDSPH